MKITQIELVSSTKPILLPAEFRPAWQEPGAQPCRELHFSFYKIHTDEGIVGIGPTGPGNVALPPEPALSQLIGKDPAYIERFWEQNMRGRDLTLGSTTCAGLEIALWDIMGKATGRPIYQLLGACRDKVMAYASTSELLSPKGHAAMAVQFWAQGIKAMKLRLHRQEIDKDLEAVAAVRDAVKDMIVMVDANQNNASPNYSYWSRRTALTMARELEKLGVYFLEEPLPRADWEGLGQLCAAVDLPIAGGEHCSNIYEHRDALFAKAYDIVQPDLILGNIGITGIRKVAVMADATGRGMIPHVCGGGNTGLYLAATLQVLGSIGGTQFIEYTLDPPALVPAAMQSILKSPIMIDPEGYVEIPQGPGLGVELDDEALANYL